MPTTATVVYRCDECNRNKRRNEFSVLNGVCLECFDQKFCFCEDCGKILRQHNSGPPYYGPHERSYNYHGQTFCYDCHYYYTEAQRYGNDRWRPTAFDLSFVSYERIGSKRKFGVEIETSNCDNYRELYHRTKFGCKADCTVSGLEFDSPVLYGDEGLDYIVEFLQFGEQNGWDVDGNCGCHTHYDMRAESDDQLKSVAYAYRKSIAIWKALVPERRHDGSYSHVPCWTCNDFRYQCVEHNCSFDDIIDALNCDRYEMVNLTAYYDHKTFEVRALEGTCDAETICNWITVNCRFIDAVKDMSFDEIDELFDGERQDQFKALSNLIDDDGLITWLKRRARNNGQPI